MAPLGLSMNKMATDLRGHKLFAEEFSRMHWYQFFPRHLYPLSARSKKEFNTEDTEGAQRALRREREEREKITLRRRERAGPQSRHAPTETPHGRNVTGCP